MASSTRDCTLVCDRYMCVRQCLYIISSVVDDVCVYACLLVTGRSTIAGIGSDNGKMGVQTGSPDKIRKQVLATGLTFC